MLEKLKKRWGLKTNIDVFMVLLVFAINGTFAAKIGKPLFTFLNIAPETLGSTTGYFFIRVITIFIIYQITFPIVGWLLGQFKFAWSFEKKMLKRLGLKFLFKEDNDTK